MHAHNQEVKLEATFSPFLCIICNGLTLKKIYGVYEEG